MTETPPAQSRVVVVGATRKAAAVFWRETALGRSLLRLNGEPRLKGVIAFENSFGLPAVYNTAIASLDAQDIVVFVHDDVWLDDYCLCQRLDEGLSHFDLLGVAGNRRRLPRQPSWLYPDMSGQRDGEEFVSGLVAHGQGPFGEISRFGPVPAACELLDGVFLAARVASLRQAGVGFDTRFDFHFYDLDFCRTARQQGLRLGTWPIALTHQSEGSFSDPKWRAGLQVYFTKWGD